MNEEVAEAKQMWRYIVLVDGEPHSKYTTKEKTYEAAADIWSMTDEPIKIETIH